MLRVLMVAASIVIAAECVAGPHDRDPAPSSTAGAAAGATAGAAAGAGARADAGAVVEAPATATASNDGVSVGGANLGVTTRVRALGVNVPGHAPATSVERCHESRGSIGALGAGSGGKVSINEKCMAFEQCMAVVRIYLDIGRHDLVVSQLAREECGGVESPTTYETPVETATPIELPQCEEHYARVFEACQSK